MKYWLTFNEINMLMHLPFGGAGVYFWHGEDPDQMKHQVAHHELVASATAVKLGHSIDTDYQISCMLAGGICHTCS